jgi:hypothetical protein
MLKILFRLLMTIYIISISLNANAQSSKEEITNLVKKNNEWYLVNVSSFLQKVPLNVADATPQQLSNAGIPDNQEKAQIDLIINQRKNYNNEYAKILRKYVKPADAAEALIKVGEDLIKKSNDEISKLKEGKINFGQYLRIRKMLIEESANNRLAILSKYQLDAYGQSVGTVSNNRSSAQSEAKLSSQGNTVNLIDTRNKGTFQGSCVGIANALQIAANNLGMEVRNRPAQTQDQRWQNDKDSKKLFDLGDSGDAYSRGWSKTDEIPPSMLSDFLNAQTTVYSKASNLARTHDGSIAVLEAFKKCRGF